MKTEEIPELHWGWQFLIKLLFILATAFAVTFAWIVAVLCVMLLGAGLNWVGTSIIAFLFGG